MSYCEIPTINIQPWLDKSDPNKIIAEIRSACMTYGFFTLSGHGISADLQRKAFDAAKRFFALPVEQKKALAKDPISGRGYEMIGQQALQAGHADLKEAMRIGREVTPEDPKYGTFLYGPNRWPNLPEVDFKIPIMEYRAQLLKVAREVMSILIKGLGYEIEVFDEYMKDPVASVKMLHYPPQPVDGELRLGAGAHTDFGAITLLMQHPGQEGLEVLHPKTKEWIPVPPVENTFVVNIGDFFSAWTNGRYLSNTHRVINQNSGDRYSIAFFFDGTMDARMTALDDSIQSGTVKTVGEHFKERFSSTYGE